MKLYTIKHVKNGKLLCVTADNFDGAVRRTFDDCLTNWICVELKTLDPTGPYKGGEMMICIQGYSPI